MPVALPPGIFDDSVEAADHLVRVPGVAVLVDGYNVSKLGWPDHSIAEQRRRLVDALSEMSARTGAEVAVVFDGADTVWSPQVPSTGRRVRVAVLAAGGGGRRRRHRPGRGAAPLPAGGGGVERQPGAGRIGGGGRQRHLVTAAAGRPAPLTVRRLRPRWLSQGSSRVPVSGFFPGDCLRASVWSEAWRSAAVIA